MIYSRIGILSTKPESNPLPPHLGFDSGPLFCDQFFGDLHGFGETVIFRVAWLLACFCSPRPHFPLLVCWFIHFCCQGGATMPTPMPAAAPAAAAPAAAAPAAVVPAAAAPAPMVAPTAAPLATLSMPPRFMTSDAYSGAVGAKEPLWDTRLARKGAWRGR